MTVLAPLLAAALALGGTAAGVRELPAAADDPQIRIHVDSARREIRITAGPFHVADMPPGMDHHGTAPEVLRFEWPVDGAMRGFRVELHDEAGRPLPGAILHHMIGVNFDRRQIVYQQVERLFGWGQETDAVMLPGGVGVPLARGTRLGMYASWHNTTGRDIHGAYIKLVLAWIPSKDKPLAVLPMYIDVNNRIGDVTTFDVPPGKSTRSYEFTFPVNGRIIGIGGHLHDHGVAVRLEDAETGKVLARLKAKRDKDGRVSGVGRFIFGFNTEALRVEKGRRYRVVSEYDNPTGQTLVQGGMGHINGAFSPDDLREWPVLDPQHPDIRKDIAALPSLGAGRATAGGRGAHHPTTDHAKKGHDGHDHGRHHSPARSARPELAKPDSTRRP